MRLLLLSVSCLATVSAGILDDLKNAGAGTLVELIQLAGLVDTLAGAGDITIFAPTDAAFAKLPAELTQTLTSDLDLLRKVLLSHIVPGKIKSTDLANDITVKSVEGSQLRVNIYLKSNFYNGFVTVNGKYVKKTDIMATNAIIHTVSDVLYPLTPDSTITDLVASDPRFSTLLAAVSAAGLAETLASEGPFTVFAPTNDAFAKIPSDALNGLLADKGALTRVLLRHVVPKTLYAKGICWETHETAGGNMDDKIATQVFKNGAVKVVSNPDGTRTGAMVVEADILASNGVIHAIDTVI